MELHRLIRDILIKYLGSNDINKTLKAYGMISSIPSRGTEVSGKGNCY